MLLEFGPKNEDNSEEEDRIQSDLDSETLQANILWPRGRGSSVID